MTQMRVGFLFIATDFSLWLQVVPSPTSLPTRTALAFRPLAKSVHIALDRELRSF